MIGIIATARSRLARSPLAQRFLGGAGWSVLGSVVSSGITLIMLMLVARLLGKEVYGQFVVIQSTLSMVGVFAGFGIGVAATRYVAELKIGDTVRLGHILTLCERTTLGFGLFASTGLLISTNWMATSMLNAPSLSKPLAISAVAVLFTTFDSYQKSVLIGFESMRAFAASTVVGVVACIPVMLLAAGNFGLQGASVAMVVNALLQASVSRYHMLGELQKHKVQLNSNGCLSEWPVLWRFAVPALLAGALVSPAHWAAQAMLANTPNGYAELAVVGIAMQWFNVIMFVPSTAGRVILPILTDHLTRKDHGSSRRIILIAMGANAIIAIPLAIISGIFSSYIMKMYGNSFAHNNTPLILAISTAAILAIHSPVGNLLAASSRMWLGTLMNSGWAIIYLALSYFFSKNGATGIMLALAIGYIAHAGWTFWFAWHLAQKRFGDADPDMDVTLQK